MLFNTLAYAKFFAIVFLVSWLLVRRASVIWLPWIAACSYWLLAGPLGQLSQPGSSSRLLSGGALLLIAGALTRWLSRQNELQNGHHTETAPSWRLLAVSCLTSFGALACFCREQTQHDLLTLSLSGLGMKLPEALTAYSSSLIGQALAALLVGGAGFLLLGTRRIRLLFILGASYVFYAHWDWRFLPLIFASSSVDYWLGLKIEEAQSDLSRKRWLLATVLLNLGVLACFKYLNFGIDTAKLALDALGVAVPETTLRIALPIGISFFTFESMSYVIDVYRRELPAHRSYLEYLSFVAFFPHLVAGPIVRPRDLLPQLGGAPRFSAAMGSEGLFLVAWGLLKKVAIGDYLAVNLVDRVFDQPIQYSSLECYSAMVGYALQIYCDFSGYTDVAIGSALLLGVRFPLNFNAPYKAADIQDFWRRWHISLSTWLRDYLYLPLGGNRKGPVRTYVNLLLTMLLGGLWHGANWTFVVWGGLHGAGLAVHRLISRRQPANAVRATNSVARTNTHEVVNQETARGDRSALRYWLGVAVTFHFVCFAWIFFRAPSFGQARIFLSQLGQLTTYHPNLHPPVLVALALGLLTHFAPEQLYHRLKRWFIALPSLAQGLLLCVAALILREMLSAEAVPFVYFQF
ncbi:MAG: rane-bound polysaccharide acetyltransferase [Pseudomonadota bacterium]